MEAFALLIALGIIGFILIGSGLGFAALRESRKNAAKLVRALRRIEVLEMRIGNASLGAPSAVVTPTEASPEPSAAVAVDEEPSDVFEVADDETLEAVPAAASVEAPPPLPPVSGPSKSKNPFSGGQSLEFDLGGKWLGWVGVVMVLIGVGFGLKYAYDRDMVPPEVRLAFGYLGGLGLLGLAEVIRRRGHQNLFQTLTGGGIGILYLCVFFSYRIYEFTDAGLSLGLGVLVTVLGVVMAVAHNALPIAVLAVLGGFLTPVLFSDGGNRPYSLFTYVALLDILALGAAYYRRWRALDVLCLAGTVILYQLWFENSYDEENLRAALLFTSLFYLMFLLIPTVYSLTRRVHMETDALSIVVINALYSLYAYYSVLYADYRNAMGFVVIAQSALVFLLFWSWSKRVSANDRTAESLLVITLSLVTLAVPIQLRLYGVPIAWAVEGALFVHLGLRYGRRTSLYGGLGAFALAAAALFYRMPLHELPFTAVVNASFGSWVMVIAAACTGTYLLRRHAMAKESDRDSVMKMALGLGLYAYVLACVLFTAEIIADWDIHRPEHFEWSLATSVLVLWTLIPTATAALIVRRELDPRAMFLPWAGYAVGAFMFLAALTEYGGDSTWLGVNRIFVAAVVFAASVWWAAIQSRRLGHLQPANILETASYILIVMVLAAEFHRWGGTPALTRQFASALLSCAWALEALLLIWFGLASRMRLRRVLGFVLFGVTVAQVVMIAFEARLDPALQIVSFIGSGLLLLAGAYFYSRFSRVLLGEEEADAEEI